MKLPTRKTQELNPASGGGSAGGGKGGSSPCEARGEAASLVASCLPVPGAKHFQAIRVDWTAPIWLLQTTPYTSSRN